MWRTPSHAPVPATDSKPCNLLGLQALACVPGSNPSSSSESAPQQPDLWQPACSCSAAWMTPLAETMSCSCRERACFCIYTGPRSQDMCNAAISASASLICLMVRYRRPLHVAALVVSVAAMALTLRLTAEQWDVIDRLPLFGPRRAVPAAWLVAQQPVPAAVPLSLPEQVRQGSRGLEECFRLGQARPTRGIPASTHCCATSNGAHHCHSRPQLRTGARTFTAASGLDLCGRWHVGTFGACDTRAAGPHDDATLDDDKPNCLRTAHKLTHVRRSPSPSGSRQRLPWTLSSRQLRMPPSRRPSRWSLSLCSSRRRLRYSPSQQTQQRLPLSWTPPQQSTRR